MHVYDLRAGDFAAAVRTFDRRYAPSPELIAKVADILAAVRGDGDAALIELTSRYDGCHLEPANFLVQPIERLEARGRIVPNLLRALEASKQNVQEFARRSQRTSWSAQNIQGAEVGERFDPFNRVGIYVPAGSAPLVSSAIMTVAIASAIGVPEIAVMTPAGAHPALNPSLLTALDLAGATEIYRLGGAQAIAALAYGTSTIPQVDKIFGPGNAYVTEAKRQVFGFVGVDLLPGPSEIMVLADDSANPRWIAADLLAQAEHGAHSIICLVTSTAELVEKVRQEILGQSKQLNRQKELTAVLEHNASAVIVGDWSQAVEVVNRFAPEHLIIVTRDAESWAEKITTAGAIFLGGYSPVALGDFVAGPSHELPTGGAAKCFSGLTVDQFQRRTSIVRYTPEALQASIPITNEFSAAEQLDGHGVSVQIRMLG